MTNICSNSAFLVEMATMANGRVSPDNDIEIFIGSPKHQ